MLREADNEVTIQGILSEIDLNYGSFVKDGKTQETIGGTIKVLVEQVINGVPTTLEIPVSMFSNRYTNKGNPNPAFLSIEKVMKEYSSIASTGNKESADKVKIDKGKIKMNEYYGKTGKFVSFPRINASFVSRVTKNFKPEAIFEAEIVIIDSNYEVDKDGIEVDPKRYIITAALPQYGEKVDVVKFVAINPKVIDAVSHYWSMGDTVKVSGKLNFSYKTETYVEQMGFGDPIEKTRTTNVSELIITGGSDVAYEPEFAYDSEEIREALKVRKENLEQQKAKEPTKKTPAPANTTSNGFNDLGF